MKKKNPASKAERAAQHYWRKAQKGRHKITKLSPEGKAARLAESQARLDMETADLKAKAAELPALRAEKERLEAKLQTEYYRLAMLAAQFHAAFDDVDMNEAVELAIKQLQAVKKMFSVPAITASAKKTEAPAQDDTGMSYEEFARHATGLKNFQQADKRLQDYVSSVEAKGRPEGWVDAKLATYRGYGKQKKLKRSDAEHLKKRILPWWREEKSRRAKIGGKARAKIRYCPECPPSKRRRLEPGKRLCRYCAVRAKVRGVGYSQDKIDITDLSDLVQAKSGKTPQRRAEY